MGANSGIFSRNGKGKMLRGYKWNSFVGSGLTEELSKFPKIEDTDQEISFSLFVERYQLVEPEPLIKEYSHITLNYMYPRDELGILKTSRDIQTIFIGNMT